MVMSATNKSQVTKPTRTRRAAKSDGSGNTVQNGHKNDKDRDGRDELVILDEQRLM